VRCHKQCCSEHRTELNGVPYDVFLKLVEFCYTGSTQVNNYEIGVALLPLASEYALPSLKDACESLLTQTMNDANVISLLEVAEKHQALQLKHYCTEFLLRNFARLSVTEQFEHLGRDLITEILANTCSKLNG